MKVNVLKCKRRPLYESFDFDADIDIDIDVESKNPKRLEELVHTVLEKLMEANNHRFLRNGYLHGHDNIKLIDYHGNNEWSGGNLICNIVDDNEDEFLYTIEKYGNKVSSYIFGSSKEKITTNSDLYKRLQRINDVLDEVLDIDPFKLQKDYFNLLDRLVNNFNKVRVNGIKNKTLLPSNNQENTLYFSTEGENRYGLSEIAKRFYKGPLYNRNSSQLYGPIGYIQSGENSEIVYSMNPLNFYRFKKAIEKELLR